MNTQPPTPPPGRDRPVTRMPLTFVLLAGAGIAAAGVGGYLAQSHRQAELPAVEASPASAPAARPASPVATPESPAPRPETQVEAPVPVEKASPRPGTAPVPAPSIPARAARSTPGPANQTRPAAPAARPAEPAPAVGTPVPEPAPPAVAEAHAPVAADPAPAPAPPSAPAPRAPEFETIVVPADAVMGLEIERSLSSETARIEERVDARVARDVRGDGNVVLIPAGSRVQGEVIVVEHGGKFKERARLGIRFHTLLLPDGQTLPIETEPLFREGDEVGKKAGVRIGASAAGGAIIGAILGGEKGAAIGAAAGAGAGTAATAASKRSEARFRAGSVVTVRLTQPLTFTQEM